MQRESRLPEHPSNDTWSLATSSLHNMMDNTNRAFFALSVIVRVLLCSSFALSMAETNPRHPVGGLPSSSSSAPSPLNTVTSQCACGRVQIQATVPSSPMPSSPPERIDCHCPACRKFHASAFVSYLPIVSDGRSDDGKDYEVLRGEADTVTYRDICSGLPATAAAGQDRNSSISTEPQPVVRVICGRCHSKLLTTISGTAPTPPAAIASSSAEEGHETAKTRGEEEEIVDGPSPSFAASTRRVYSWINMGPLLEGKGRFPTPLMRLEPRPVGGNPVDWSLVRPDPQSAQQEDNNSGSTEEDEGALAFAYGRCSCSQARYRILKYPTELQHCYCRLCRQYSGGPFMTWMPAPYLEWLDREGRPSLTAEPPLVRTTSHGRRHFCPSCHSCLTIVYDDQPDTIWPVAASLEDSTALSLYSASHICCRYRPMWYALPTDGLPRIQEAS
jgi:hypothetical protein